MMAPVMGSALNTTSELSIGTCVFKADWAGLLESGPHGTASHWAQSRPNSPLRVHVTLPEIGESALSQKSTINKERRVWVHRDAKLAVGVAIPRIEEKQLGHKHHPAEPVLQAVRISKALRIVMALLQRG